MGLTLRPYQKECLEAIHNAGTGRFIINLPVGSGKTVIFTSIPRKGRTLIIAHRQELLEQPIKYLNCKVGVEKGVFKSNGEDVVCASIQSLIRRYKKFDPQEFHTIIYDEVHRITSKTSLKVIDYFNPYRLLGFSATLSRTDGVGLDSVFEKIIYQKTIEWMIQQGYLCNIKCYAVDVGYDLSQIKTKMGDLDNKELSNTMMADAIVEAVAEAYYKLAKGLTVIFACSIDHAEKIKCHIKESEVITGKSKNRHEILDKFRKDKIKCLINVNILTEGIDIPNISTVIFARPTKSKILYIQSIGRGLRLYDDKEYLTLIDVVGNTGRHDICQAPTLLGLSVQNVSNKSKVEGMIFNLPDKIMELSDVPESWINNIKTVKMFIKQKKYNTYDVNYFKMPDNSLVCNIPKKLFKVLPENHLGKSSVICSDGRVKRDIKIQECFDIVFKELKNNHNDCQPIWNLNISRQWQNFSATDKQLKIIKHMLPNFKFEHLNKLQASYILNRLFRKV